MPPLPNSFWDDSSEEHVSYAFIDRPVFILVSTTSGKLGLVLESDEGTLFCALKPDTHPSGVPQHLRGVIPDLREIPKGTRKWTGTLQWSKKRAGIINLRFSISKRLLKQVECFPQDVKDWLLQRAEWVRLP